MQIIIGIVAAIIGFNMEQKWLSFTPNTPLLLIELPV